MQGSLEILKPGLMTSIQDLGRQGLSYYAIPTSGAMDQKAARIALLLLSLSEEYPLIECTSNAPEIIFHTPTRVVLTGADFGWKLNNNPVVINSVFEVQASDVLKGGFARDGLRGYVAVDGLLETSNEFNSYSTYTNAAFGGHHGRLLKKGDQLFWNASLHADLIIPIHKGPEFDYLTALSKFQLTENEYSIGAESNRMGARLEGERLDSSSYQLNNSAPVLPGFIQLPPSGKPIVVLQDGQTTGGYPRIAYIHENNLSRFNQIPLGGRFKFILE